MNKRARPEHIALRKGNGNSRARQLTPAELEDWYRSASGADRPKQPYRIEEIPNDTQSQRQ